MPPARWTGIRWMPDPRPRGGPRRQAGYRHLTTTRIPYPILGAQPGTLWVQRLRRNRLPRHLLKRHALDECGEDELRLHHREVITDTDVRTSSAPKVTRGIKSCRAPLIGRCGMGLRRPAPEWARWYNHAHVIAPVEQFRMDAEKDRVMHQQSVTPQIDGVPASPQERRTQDRTAPSSQLPRLIATSNAPHHGLPTLRPARSLILVVDDHYEIRVALAELLEDEGYQVITAAHGQEALTLLRRGTVRPALIVLDLMMPVMDGWTFREIQGSDPALQAIPVVVISAISNVQQQRHPVPAAAYLPKPLNFALLLETVTRFCCPT